MIVSLRLGLNTAFVLLIVRQCRLVISYTRFGTTYPSHIRSTIEDGTDRLHRNSSSYQSKKVKVNCPRYRPGYGPEGG